MCAWQVDEAAAKLKMEITSKPQHLDEIDRKILQLEMERLSLAKVGSHARHPCAESCIYVKMLFVSVDRHNNRAEPGESMSVIQFSLPLLLMPGLMACCNGLKVFVVWKLNHCRKSSPFIVVDRWWVCACVQAATADKTAKQRLSQLDAQLNELKKEQAELTKQWEREKVRPSCLHRYP